MERVCVCIRAGEARARHRKDDTRDAAAAPARELRSNWDAPAAICRSLLVPVRTLAGRCARLAACAWLFAALSRN